MEPLINAHGTLMAAELFHAGEFGVADEVFLEVRVEGALAAQPGEGAFCFLTQMNLRKLRFSFVGLAGALDFDFDQVGAGGAKGAGLGVLTTGGNQLGLGERVGGEDFEDRVEVLIGKLVGVATEQAANITTGEAASAGDVALVELPPLGLTLEGDAEIAHFFGLWRSLYATFMCWQQVNGTPGRHGTNGGCGFESCGAR